MDRPAPIRPIPCRPVRRRWPGLLALGLLVVAGGGALLMHQTESTLATIAEAEALQAAAASAPDAD